MATNKKFIVKNGLQTPSIDFVSTSSTGTITATKLDSGVLSFSGLSGQLFSIADSMTGTIFAVNDISGIPSIEVYDSGKIQLAETFGNVLIGTSTDNGSKLQVNGTATILSSVSVSNTNTGALQVVGGLGVGGGGYFGGIVTATNFYVGPWAVSTGSGASLGTIQQSTNANYFLTFVDTNNSSLTSESFYTTSSLYVNPSNGVVTLSSTVNSTSTTTGALVVNGGIGISGNIVSNGVAYLGPNATNTVLVNPTLVAKSVSSASTSGQYYVQIALANGSPTGSGDFISYVDTYVGPSSDHGWVDVGITGSNFGDPNYTITGKQDGYLFASSTSTAGTGNLVLATDGTGSTNDIVFGTGGFLAANEKIRFVNTTSQFWIKATTTATSTTTGALRVNGGAGIGGALFVGGSVNISSGVASTNTETGALVVNGGVGINGALNAITKSFVIDHPTKPGKKLRYGSLEGPENGVYIRGKLTGNNIIELPEYWTKLVDSNSITVSLTPIGKHQNLYVEDISDNKVVVGNSNVFGKEINCFFTVFAERVDIAKLVVEM